MQEEIIIKKVSIVIIGIDGYGKRYLNWLLQEGEKYKVVIAGVVDIHPKNSYIYTEVVKNNIPIFPSIEEFYDNEHADLAIISTPIHLHAYQSCYALEHGSNVLCEKPMCATIQEAHQMIETRDRSGNFLAIGFDWSFNPSVIQLKQDIINNEFGKPQRFKSLLLLPRSENYYNRTSWAGKMYSEKGEPILDSVANNAGAHSLHYMFFLLGSGLNRSAQLKQVTAELYRANPIESYDTCALKAKVEDDITIHFYATHATKNNWGPIFSFEFEQAIMSYTPGDSNSLEVNFNDGRRRFYSGPLQTSPMQKLIDCIKSIVLNVKDVTCGPEASYTHTLCVNNMHRSFIRIADFDPSLIRQDNDVTWVEGLDETLIKSFNQWMMPSDINKPWTKKGNPINIASLK